MCIRDRFSVTYSADTSGRAFFLNGNWDSDYFDNVVVTDTNISHADVFTEGTSGTAIASSQVAITDEDGAEIFVAEIVLTNAQIDDALNVSDLPDGITAEIDTSVPGQITVSLTGVGDHTAYEDALKAIEFHNPSDTLATVPRIIEISVSDGENWSEPAETTVHVNDICLLYTSPSPRDQRGSRMPSSA